ncbi:MAG: fibronectin type III domain-containing protein [Ignavibacteriaceae bacterium]
MGSIDKKIKTGITSKVIWMKVCIIFLSFLMLQACADLSTGPDQNNDSNYSNLKIKISSPVSNASLSEGLDEIIYSIENPYSLKFIELYIDGVFKKNYPPNANGTAPQIFYNFDSTYIGKIINLYLVYYDSNNTSAKSNVISDVVITTDNHLPYKPYNVTLLKFDDGSCNIGWKDTSKYVEKYEIWKKAGIEGEYSLLKEVSGNSNNMNDYNLDSSIIYFYKIRGVKSSGVSSFSNEVNTGGIITSGNLYPPSNLSATLTGSSSVRLNWKDNSDDENYFVVERSTNNINFISVASLSQNTTSYNDAGSGLVLGSTYYYRVKSYSNTDSAFSNTITVKFLSTILQAPSNLTAVYNQSAGVIELSWNNSDNNTVYFDIERKINDGDYQVIRRVDATSLLFLDFNILVNNDYKYRVRGYDLNVYSDYSNEVTISTY